MSLPNSLNVGLKEWATVCRAHGQGRQLVLLRKGGISEAIGGFEIEHRQFLFFPTYLHQNLDMLKSTEHAGFQKFAEEPSEVRIDSAGEITDIIQLKSREQVDRINDEHIWTSPLIDMRFNYRPKNPLYLLIVRSYRLAQPVTIQNTPDYAGCKSWVPLASAIDTSTATPVLDNPTFDSRRQQILAKLG
jgi:hypothetical protein